MYTEACVRVYGGLRADSARASEGGGPAACTAARAMHWQ
jgi:hypothetical protein